MQRCILLVGALVALLLSVGCGGGGDNGTRIEERTLIVGSQGSGANGYVYIPAGGAMGARTSNEFSVSAFPRPGGKPAAADTQITLRSRAGQEYEAAVGSGGSFHCGGVPQGDYTLVVRGTVNGTQAESTYYGAVDIAQFASQPQVNATVECVNGCAGQAGLTDGLACTIHYLDGSTEFYLMLTNPTTNGDRLFAFADTAPPRAGSDHTFVADAGWAGTYPVTIAAFIESEASTWIWGDIVPGYLAGGNVDPTGGIHWTTYQGGDSGMVTGTVNGEINGWNVDGAGSAVSGSRVHVAGTFAVPVYEESDTYWQESTSNGW
jgi:hypothetical protein